MLQLRRRAAREPGIFGDGKTDLRAALYADNDFAIFVNDGNRAVSQGIHATFQSSPFVFFRKFFGAGQFLKLEAVRFAQLNRIPDVKHRLTAAVPDVDVNRTMLVHLKEKPKTVFVKNRRHCEFAEPYFRPHRLSSETPRPPVADCEFPIPTGSSPVSSNRMALEKLAAKISFKPNSEMEICDGDPVPKGHPIIARRFNAGKETTADEFRRNG